MSDQIRFNMDNLSGGLVFGAELKHKQLRVAYLLLTKGSYMAFREYVRFCESGSYERLNTPTLRSLRRDNQFGAEALNPAKSGRMLSRLKELYNVDRLQTPSKIKPGEAIGIEIEFFVPIDAVEARNDNTEEPSNCDDGCDDGCDDCSGESSRGDFEKGRKYFTNACFERRIKGVNITSDGSINCSESSYIAYEARILVEHNDMSNLEKFCKLLSDLGAKVNTSCGLHVHLDVRDYERRPAALVKRLATALPIFKAMVPKSRLNNTFCSVDVGSESTARDKTRYACINDYLAFNKFKTIEIRLHSGTISYTKISNWVRILRSVARAGHIRIVNNTIEEYSAKLGWSAQLTAYVVNRVQKFNPNHALLGLGNEMNLNQQDTLDLNHEDSELAA